MNRMMTKLTLVLTTGLVVGGASLLLAAAEQAQVPAPELQDMITHDKGNIRTTVSNWGTIGGLSHLGYPSGEWPKGSGHNYLAEIKYWMGATADDGADTMLANTADDFEPIVDLASATDQYIRLSTDTDRYNYDPADTTGEGLGHPADGWRVWDPEQRAWVYNKVWDPVAQQFYDGGPTAQQESIYRFDDAALGSPLLGVEMVQTIYQWNYSYNQDILFVVLQITNRSGHDYQDFAFGLYCDFDVGGPDGTGENGRLGDLVASDTSLNLAWTYDADGYDPGWGPTVVTGIMGTRYIETPNNIGMTAFRTGEWEQIDATKDDEKYAYITAHTYDQSLPPTDQYYIQATSGITLKQDSTVRIVYALIAGYDEADFRAKSQMALSLYQNNFIGPAPPNAPTLSAFVGSHEARLFWNRDAIESTDPMSGLQDFAGYKLFRSTDRGLSWGQLERHPDGSTGPDYTPLAVWRVENAADPIPHTYVDTSLTNGYEYWYSVVAFDEGDTAVGVGPLQTAYGRPGEDVNAVKVVPHSEPAGYYDIESTLQHEVEGAGTPSGGHVVPTLFDEGAMSGSEYEVGFVDDPYQTTWYVVNRDNGDTLVKDLTDQTGDESLAPVADGVQLFVYNGDREAAYYHQVGLTAGADTTLKLGYTYGPMGDAFGFPLGGDMHFRPTYQLRFTADGSVGYSLYDDVTPIQLPFEVWNMATGQQVNAEIYHLDPSTPGWDPRNRDYISILNVPYDGSPHPEAFPYYFAWFFRLDTESYNYNAGDVFEIGGAPLNGPDDKFVYSTPGIDKSVAANQLDRVRAVPNPYIGRASWERDKGIRRMEFVNLPEKATIRIYTLAGDLVQTLEHSGSGTCVWDMLSMNGQGIAPGLYFYHIDSDVGQKIGKFSVIK